MAAVIKIELNRLQFFAGSGIYEEEVKVGNQFEVDVSINYKLPDNKFITLDHTINYVDVLEVVRIELNKKFDLLESCVQSIAFEMEKRFKTMDKLTICIRKVNPPITNFSGSVSVSYSKQF